MKIFRIGALFFVTLIDAWQIPKTTIILPDNLPTRRNSSISIIVPIKKQPISVHFGKISQQTSIFHGQLITLPVKYTGSKQFKNKFRKKRQILNTQITKKIWQPSQTQTAWITFNITDNNLYFSGVTNFANLQQQFFNNSFLTEKNIDFTEKYFNKKPAKS
ncbi:MAG: hypothetical protein LBT09_04165 [Planctomycetaceae bacterium]|nr:hypothetical protein [Planctomycetaceae bacterium]